MSTTNGMVDLISDTATRPTPAMYEAMRDAPLGDEQKGEDPTVTLLQGRAAELLEEHFPESYHEELLAAVGLSLGATGRETVTRARRDPRFPIAVRRAYAHRCGFCGLDRQ